MIHEGQVNLLFDNEAPEPPSSLISQGTSADGNDKKGIDQEIFHPMGNWAKDIVLFQN